MTQPSDRHSPPVVYAGILLCSVGVLMLEILLTRIFSFTIWYHLAYLTISTALLGFGAAGSILAAFPSLLERDPRRLAALASAGSGLALLATLALLAPRPLDPFTLFETPGRFFLGLLGYYVAVMIPFLLAGIAIATPLAAYPRDVNRLYAADLLGAGIGCALAVAGLSLLDGPGVLTVGAALLVGAGALYAGTGRLALGLGVTAVALLAAVPAAERVFAFRPAESKVLAKSLREPGTELLFTKWSPVNRVDLYRDANPRFTFWAGYGRNPDYEGPIPSSLSIQYDAHNGSSVYEVTGPDSLAMLDEHILRTPYILTNAPRVLVIGVGGGIDVLNALRRGASSVTAVELQPIVVDLHHGMLASFTGGQFQRPEVELVAGEGRHYVRGDDRSYDVVQITMTDTFSAQTTGAYVLAESYLYTLEAFGDYLDRLSDDGILSLVLGNFEYRDSVSSPLAARLALTAREALVRSGSARPESHILIAAHRNRIEDSVVGSIIFDLLVKKTPFEPDEVDRIRGFLEANSFDLIVAPGDGEATAWSRLLRAPGDAPTGGLGDSAFRIDPTTDDRPFFYNVLRWTTLLGHERTHSSFPGSSTGQIMLLLMLGQALLLGTLLILLPLVRGPRTALSKRETAGFLLYFLGLGLGFMLIEISFVQKYVLLLGYPTYSLSVTVFSLLVFAAGGAALCRRWWGEPRRFLLILLGLTLACLAIETWLVPWAREAFLAEPLWVRVAVTVLLQLPLGTCLGMYFPTGAELLRRREPRLVPWAWGVNGVASVASTVLAVILAMAIGFTGVVIVAAAVYTAGTLALLTVVPGRSA